ncbi:MAG TPA: plastocyanin/azurin family copper-binding protein [Opitutaceae bacterium]|nr:plastocyanin/azurin family copper-binding protein [Opitutaceae bacterium]
MKTQPRARKLLWILGAALGLAGVGPAAPAAGSPRVIALTGDDTMHYNLTEIDARPGEALEVQLTNIGQLPKAAMSHNWVLLRPMSDADVSAFAISAMSKAPDYLPDDRSAVLAHTRTLGPKETDSVDFTAPTTPGTYPFLCTFPGHFALMKGRLVVK